MWSSPNELLDLNSAACSLSLSLHRAPETRGMLKCSSVILVQSPGSKQQPFVIANKTLQNSRHRRLYLFQSINTGIPIWSQIFKPDHRSLKSGLMGFAASLFFSLRCVSGTVKYQLKFPKRWPGIYMEPIIIIKHYDFANNASLVSFLPRLPARSVVMQQRRRRWRHHRSPSPSYFSSYTLKTSMGILSNFRNLY